MALVSGPTTIHLRLDIRDLLWDALDESRFEGMFMDEQGRTLEPRETFDRMVDSLQKGHRFLRCGDGEDLDPFEKGCSGHPEMTYQGDGILRGNVDLVPAQHADGWAPR